MQTFMPYPDMDRCAKVLDRQRLGKQRVECQQILQALAGGTGWSNHPATKMWRGHERALAIYGLSMTTEWVKRGYKDTRRPVLIELAKSFSHTSVIEPAWWGDPRVHHSHQAMLLRKDREHYQLAFSMSDQQVQGLLDKHQSYIWPV